MARATSEGKVQGESEGKGEGQGEGDGEGDGLTLQMSDLPCVGQLTGLSTTSVMFSKSVPMLAFPLCPVISAEESIQRPKVLLIVERASSECCDCERRKNTCW